MIVIGLIALLTRQKRKNAGSFHIPYVGMVFLVDRLLKNEANVTSVKSSKLILLSPVKIHKKHKKEARRAGFFFIIIFSAGCK
jgi:hypothetical protein